MRLISFNESVSWLAEHRLGDISEIVGALESTKSYTIVSQASRQTFLARRIAADWPKSPGAETLLLVLEYDIFPSCANPALFERYRARGGEPVQVSDLQGHLLDSSETEFLEGLLALTLYFFWGVLMVDSQGFCRLLSSHDSWIVASDKREGVDNVARVLAEVCGP